MKFKGELIGNDDAAFKDIDEAILSLNRLPKSLNDGAEKIVKTAKHIATAKGLNKTGAGVNGIIYEVEKNDRLIGWAPRPNLHLFFQEIGTYKDPARPHLRPAADQEENEILEMIRKNVVGD